MSLRKYWEKRGGIPDEMSVAEFRVLDRCARCPDYARQLREAINGWLAAHQTGTGRQDVSKTDAALHLRKLWPTKTLPEIADALGLADEDSAKALLHRLGLKYKGRPKGGRRQR